MPHDVRPPSKTRATASPSTTAGSAELWLAKNLKLATKDAPGALYPELSNGEFIGVHHPAQGHERLSRTGGSRRHLHPALPTVTAGRQPPRASRPTLTSCWRFPIANDTKPDAVYPFDKLVALSAKSTGAHPAVIAMEKAGEPGTAVFDDQKLLVLTVSIASSAAGKPEALGIVLKGQAAQ